MGSSLFGQSAYLTVPESKSRLQSVLRSLIRPNTSDRVVVIGQSIDNDIAMLQRDPAFKLSLEPIIGPNYQVFDTHILGQLARRQGHPFLSMSLASIARGVGIEKRYHLGTGLAACHNASNDAAYTLLTLLTLALRWKDLTGRGTCTREAAQQAWVNTGLVVGGYSDGPAQKAMSSDHMFADGQPYSRHHRRTSRRLRREVTVRRGLSWTQRLWQSLRTFFNYNP